MKTINCLLIFVLGIFLLSSCKKYLDRTPAADVSDKDVFGTYDSFQGFLDPNYTEVINYTTTYDCSSMDIGGETHSYIGWQSGYVANNGDYIYLTQNGSVSLWRRTYSVSSGAGIWRGGWEGIRRSNLALQQMNLLSDATDEQRKFLLGQIYFFRAFFHEGIIESYGGMPYVTKVFSATDPLNLPRLPYKVAVDSIVKDYDKAIENLPADWDKTVTGSRFPNANSGRATKGAALAYKAKLLLYAASPLMNKFSGNDYTYNVDYAKKAAAAAWDFLSFNAATPTYSLLPLNRYYEMFYKNDGTMPWTDETIFQRVKREVGSAMWTNVAYLYAPARMAKTGSSTESVNQ